VKIAETGKNVAHSLRWLKMVNIWRTLKNGSKWKKCGVLQKLAQNDKNVAHS